MVSSAEMALREGKRRKGWKRECLRLASLITFVLWSSPITKLAIDLFPYNAPEEYLLVAQKDAETVKLFNVLD